jgi:purine-binding chemotaxis protein CheW
MENKIEINTYLSFLIDNEYFAVNVAKVLEVLQMQKITRVPNVADDIKGVINFRGEIIPVFETRTRFGLPDRNITDKYVVIVLEITSNDNTSLIGAIADKVKDVITIEQKDIMPVPKMKTKIRAELITGILKLKEDFIMLLDVNKMFSEQEIEALSELVLNQE